MHSDVNHCCKVAGLKSVMTLLFEARDGEKKKKITKKSVWLLKLMVVVKSNGFQNSSQ